MDNAVLRYLVEQILLDITVVSKIDHSYRSVSRLLNREKIKVPHFIKTYTLSDPTSQDGDLNV